MKTSRDNEQIEKILRGDDDYVLPFDVVINTKRYTCSEILRLLPGKRLVVKAEYNGKQLVIKLFVKRKKGERELAREKRGYQLAKQAGVHVPKLVFATDDLQDYCAIAYRYLKKAKPFRKFSRNKASKRNVIYQHNQFYGCYSFFTRGTHR